MELYDMALEANDEITKKSGTRTLDDKSSSDSEPLGWEDSDGKASVLILSDVGGSQEEDAKEVKEVKHKDHGKMKKGDSKADQTLVTVKGYRVSNPLETKRPRVKAATTQANEAITAIGSYFNPEEVRNHNDSRAIQSLHLSQLQSAQIELREARAKNENLQDKLYEQTRRADKFETKYEMLKERFEDFNRELKEPHHRRRRRRSYSSGSHSPRRSRRPRNYSHSPHQFSPHHNKASEPSSSKHTLDDEGSIMMRMTPKRNRAGHVESVELIPST